MIIDCISDLHGHYPELEGGDLLIVAGDIMPSDDQERFVGYLIWLAKQKYQKIILIGGNHDNLFIKHQDILLRSADFDYLIDSGTHFGGLKIWGSPWTKKFEGMNPRCMAFTTEDEEEVTKWGTKKFTADEQLAKKWALIPDDTDILVTHCPPYGTLSKTFVGAHLYCYTGSFSLREAVEKIKPQLHVFGHIHESYGQERLERKGGKCTHSVNASHVNEHYEPVNKPIRIEL